MKIEEKRVESSQILSGDRALVTELTALCADLAVAADDVKVNADPESFSAAPAGEGLCLYILDLRAGAQAVHEILSRFARLGTTMVHPTVLLAEKLTTEIMAMAAEHRVRAVVTTEGGSLADDIRRVVRGANVTGGVAPHLREVAAARQEKNWAKAEKILITLHALVPDDSSVAIELAENLIQTEDWQGAMRLLAPLYQDVAVDDNPRGPHLLGRCLMHFGRMGEAVKLLERASALNPRNVDRLVELGHAYLKIDRGNEARSTFAKALSMQGGHRDAKQGLAQAELTDGNTMRAMELLRDAANPHELGAIFNSAAIVSLHRGHFDKGLELYDLAVGMVGDESALIAKLYFNKGIAFCKQRQNPNAIECFEQALASDAQHAGAAHNLRILRGSTPTRGLEFSEQGISKPTRDLSPAEFADAGDDGDDEFLINADEKGVA